MKKCNRCLNVLEHSNFHKKLASPDKLNNICKGCKKELNDKYYENNLDKKLAYQHEYQGLNYDKIKEYNKKYGKTYNPIYFQKNKEKIYKREREYYKKHKKNTNIKRNTDRKRRYFNDVSYKLRILIRGRIKSTVQKQGGIRTLSVLEYIKCSLEYFKEYIELKFYPEMTWENHGEIWEIDHIIPCWSFDLTLLEEQEKCFHYTNNQPLFKTTEIAESFGYKGLIGNRNKPRPTRSQK